MLKPTHTAVGLFTSLAVMAAFNPELTFQEAIWGSASVFVSSTLPDCDLLDNRADNTYAELVDTVKHCFLPFSIWLYFRIFVMREQIYLYRGESLKTAVMQLLIWFVMLHFTVVSPHRGWSHSIVWMIAFTFLWRWMIPDGISYKWFYWGYTSHLAIDLLNKVGEPILFPMDMRFGLKWCKSDGIVNTLSLYLAGAGYVYLLYALKEGLECNILSLAYSWLSVAWQAIS